LQFTGINNPDIGPFENTHDCPRSALTKYKTAQFYF